MDRRSFIATVGVASAVAVAATALEPDWAHAEPSPRPGSPPPTQVDNRFLTVLTRVNELQIPAVLSGYRQQIADLASPRALAQSALRLVSAYVNTRSTLYYHRAALLGPLGELLDALSDRQNPSGLYDIGNLDSPPDTSFVISDLGLGYDLLAADNQPATAAARTAYATIMRRSGRALAEGGVHTPNHRWEICKALAHLYHLWPSRLLLARINDWLGEGIDQDAEGEYSERSAIYASEVTNRSLVVVARYTDKPRLLENVRRNLELTLYKIQPNGDVETVHSRRQDQTGVQDIWKYLTHYRELAIRTGDERFSAVAEQILDRVEANPESFATPATRSASSWPRPWPTPTSRRCSRASAARHALRAVLPRLAAGADPPGQHLREHLRRHRLAQPPPGFRRPADHHPGDRLRTLHEPDLLQSPQGRGVLDSVRMSPRFFSTGHFRSDGVSAAGGVWRLRDRVEVPYHLPLPQRYRRRDGDYALGSEGRFYSKMDFPHRPKAYKVLDTTITIRQIGDAAFDLQFVVDGPHTSLTIELCFRTGGSLTGVVPATGDGNFQLVDRRGRLHRRHRHDHLRSRQRQQHPPADCHGSRREVHLPRWQSRAGRATGLHHRAGALPVHTVSPLTPVHWTGVHRPTVALSHR